MYEMPQSTEYELNLRQSMATTSDIFQLYIDAVQNPEETVRNCRSLYMKQYGSSPLMVREDFCGTAANCIAWVIEHDSAHLFGIDHDDLPLEWCRSNLIPSLTDDQRRRIDLIHSDVMAPVLPTADLILALNCSFCVFKERADLIGYFRSCRKALGDCGMLILEVYAGPEAQMVGTDNIYCEGFTAVWEQARFNAVTNETSAHLHF
jgi:hypothetical protein